MIMGSSLYLWPATLRSGCDTPFEKSSVNEVSGTTYIIRLHTTSQGTGTAVAPIRTCKVTFPIVLSVLPIASRSDSQVFAIE